VEISESLVLDPEKKDPIAAVAISGKEIRIAIETALGRRWKKVEIIPEKELDYPEPQIGRYPGAKLRAACINIQESSDGGAFWFCSFFGVGFMISNRRARNLTS
jgi:hypothetical protein